MDGVGIETGEQSSAKERYADYLPYPSSPRQATVRCLPPLRYAGRLTTDALVEKIGHNFWEHVRELDLSRSKIRELEGLQVR